MSAETAARQSTDVFTRDMFTCDDQHGSEMGVFAHRTDGSITLSTDSGDSATTTLSAHDARMLARWLNHAADWADAQQASK